MLSRPTRTIVAALVATSSILVSGIPATYSAPALTRAEKPKPPFKLAKPPEPSKDFNGHDLSAIEGDQLASAAMQLANQGKHKQAVPLQHWAVRSTGSGQYNLACFCAMSGDKEAAFYWLQDAAMTDGVDASWAARDTDLAELRRDPRWGQIAAYLKACNEYWTESGIHAEVLVLPRGYKRGTPIGVLVGMHGLGSRPDHFVSEETYQEFADDLKLAFVGVSGTNATGPHGFVWAEDPEKDHEQVQRALNAVSDRVTVKAGDVILFGFSQGAEMAFEVAFAHPSDYRGALVMSPGTSKPSTLKGLKPAAGNKTQGFVFLCGAGEAPGNVLYTKRDASLAERAGARVELKLFEGVTTHTFPPDFADELKRRVRFIQGEK
jgi:predicted esterase